MRAAGQRGERQKKGIVFVSSKGLQRWKIPGGVLLLFSLRIQAWKQSVGAS